MITGAWHRPEDELPPAGKRVLCLKKTRAGTLTYYLGCYDGRWVCGMVPNVVAWMYLPDPPEYLTVKKEKGKIDIGKAQALRNAGWKLKDIADEMDVTAARISQVTTPPAPKKKYEHEWNEQDPPVLQSPQLL